MPGEPIVTDDAADADAELPAELETGQDRRRQLRILELRVAEIPQADRPGRQAAAAPLGLDRAAEHPRPVPPGGGLRARQIDAAHAAVDEPRGRRTLVHPAGDQGVVRAGDPQRLAELEPRGAETKAAAAIVEIDAPGGAQQTGTQDAVDPRAMESGAEGVVQRGDHPRQPREARAADGKRLDTGEAPVPDPAAGELGLIERPERHPGAVGEAGVEQAVAGAGVEHEAAALAVDGDLEQRQRMGVVERHWLGRQRIHPIPGTLETLDLLGPRVAPEQAQPGRGRGQVTPAHGHVGLEPDEIDMGPVHPARNVQLRRDLIHAVGEHADLRAAQRDLRPVLRRQLRELRQDLIGLGIAPIGEEPGGEAAQVGDFQGSDVGHHGLGRVGGGVASAAFSAWLVRTVRAKAPTANRSRRRAGTCRL